MDETQQSYLVDTAADVLHTSAWGGSEPSTRGVDFDFRGPTAAEYEYDDDDQVVVRFDSAYDGVLNKGLMVPYMVPYTSSPATLCEIVAEIQGQCDGNLGHEPYAFSVGDCRVVDTLKAAIEEAGVSTEVAVVVDVKPRFVFVQLECEMGVSVGEPFTCIPSDTTRKSLMINLRTMLGSPDVLLTNFYLDKCRIHNQR